MFALSKTVVASLQSEQAAQLRTMCAIALDLLTQPSEGLAASLFACPAWTRSEKTAENYAAASKALFAKLGEQVANVAAAEQDPSKAATRLTQIVKGQLQQTTYQSSPEDVSNWCAGRPSRTDKAAAAAQKAADDAAAIAKFNQETAAAHAAAHAAAQTAEANKAAEETEAAAEAAAVRDAITAAQVEAAAADPISAPINPAIDASAAEVKAAAVDPLATPPAKPAKDNNPVVLSVRRNKAGELYIVADESLTFDDYRNMAATLASMADTEEAAFDANAARLNAEAEAAAAYALRIAEAEACAV